MATAKLDLHGKTYAEAKDAVILMIATIEPPYRIITGNSTKMKEVVTCILDENSFYYYFDSWYNLGCIVVVEA